MTFEIDGLTTAARQPDGQVTVYELADGSLFPVAGPPSLADGTYGPEVQEAARIVREALGQLAGVEGQRRAAAGDPALSELGRRQKVEAVRQVARVGLEMARAELEKLRDETGRREAALYGPPPLADYPQEKFDTNLPEWEARIQQGHSSPDRLAKLIATKGQQFTAEQRKTLDGIKRA